MDIGSFHISMLFVWIPCIRIGPQRNTSQQTGLEDRTQRKIMKFIKGHEWERVPPYFGSYDNVPCVLKPIQIEELFLLSLEEIFLF